MESNQSKYLAAILVGGLITAFGVFLLIDGLLWVWPWVAGPGLMIFGFMKNGEKKRHSSAQKLSSPDAEAKGFLIKTDEFEMRLHRLAEKFPTFFQGEILDLLLREHEKLEGGMKFKHSVVRPGTDDKTRFQVQLWKKKDGNTSLVFRGDAKLLALIS